VREPIRKVREVAAGLVGGVVLGVLALLALLGIVLLILWLREPSASSYARTHVQALFVNRPREQSRVVAGSTRVCNLASHFGRAE
jgi:hypothetical protein